MVIKSNFWLWKNVFITGHTGFKGGWLSLWLSSLGAKVFGYSPALTSRPIFFEVVSLGKVVSTCTNDILCLHSLIDEMKNAQPEMVFHLAARPLVGKSYHFPV